MSPALEWLIQSIAQPSYATKENFQIVLQLYRDNSNDATILKYIIDFYDISYYSHALLGMISLIKSSSVTYFNVVDLFTALGKQFLKCFPVHEMQQKLVILNEIWKTVTASEDMNSYIKCCTVWTEIVQKYYTERELVIILSDLGKRIEKYSNLDVPEHLQKYLESLILTLLNDSNANNKNINSGSALLQSENLLKILDTFGNAKKIHLCKVSDYSIFPRFKFIFV